MKSHKKIPLSLTFIAAAVHDLLDKKISESPRVFKHKRRREIAFTSKAIERDSIKTLRVASDYFLKGMKLFRYHFSLSSKMQTTKTLFIK